MQQGVPASEINTFVQTALGFSQLSGGNPNLTEETSDTFTVGAVVRVPWIDRFNVAVDYFKIEVEDAVATMNAQTTLDVCYQLLDATARRARRSSVCPIAARCFRCARATATSARWPSKASTSPPTTPSACPCAGASATRRGSRLRPQCRLAFRACEPDRRCRADRLRRLLRLVHGTGRRRLARFQGHLHGHLQQRAAPVAHPSAIHR